MDPEQLGEAGASSSDELRLPLFSKLTSNVGYYHLDSPLHVSASVPFRWEEEPGKPRRCASSSSSMISSSSSSSSVRCLELPPRLLLLDAAGATTKLASPTTVLEGPYITSKPRSQSSSSFRVARKDWIYGSFRKSPAGGASSRTSPDVEKLQGYHFGDVAPVRGGVKQRGLFGSFRMGRRAKREEVMGGGGHGDSYVFPSFMEGEREGDVDDNGGGGCFEGDHEKVGRRSTTGIFSALSHNTRAHFWATIYEGLKQVVPWRRRSSSRKSKRGDGFVI